jgi:HPt (histidine-containing phosphotransfer) domain-containing protein
MDAPVLDAAVIASLRDLTLPGEPDVLAEVLTMFLAEVPRRLDRLRIAYAAGDIEEVHRCAHSLKGSAGNIGARDLYAACRELDERAKAGDHAAAGPFVATLGVEFRKVETAIHRLMTIS